MKKIICLLLSLVTILSLSACRKVDSPDFYEEGSYILENGEYILSEEYMSYINSVQSQLMKKYGEDFQFNYLQDKELEYKTYVAYFTVFNTEIDVMVDCVRNTIVSDNYLKSKTSVETKEQLAKIYKENYLEGLQFNPNNKEIFNFNFEIINDNEEIQENFLFDTKVDKTFKITIKTNQLINFSCNEETINSRRFNLKKFVDNELNNVTNFTIYENLENCGTIKLNKTYGNVSVVFDRMVK